MITERAAALAARQEFEDAMGGVSAAARGVRQPEQRTTADRLPDMGPNPIEDALRNYQQMEHDLGLARAELAGKNDMLNDLLRENEFLRRNHDKAVAERDRYQALAVNLATRAVGVKEAVERLLVEAVSAKAPPADEAKPIVAPDGLAAEMEQLLRLPKAPGQVGVGRPLTERITETRVPDISWLPT